MKKIILMHAVIVMYVAFIASDASCQSIVGFAKVKMRVPEIIKQQDKLAATVNTSNKYINNANIKVVRAFIKEFKNVENVDWRKTHDGGYVAQFKKDSIQTIVRYAANGSCNYMLKKY